MSRNYGIIDLFAGPGGLGEGFSEAGRVTDVRMNICLSVEMEVNAVRTLRLRSFLRNFEGGFPPEYYESLNRNEVLPDWAMIYPKQWKKAESEVRQLELGKDGVFDNVSKFLDQTIDEYGGNTILIGGSDSRAINPIHRNFFQC